MNDTEALLAYMRLRLNIDHPDLEDCYAFGYECSSNELSEKENPFAAGTDEHFQWEEGWWAGFYGEAPLFALTQPAESVEGRRMKTVAANDRFYHTLPQSIMANLWRITGALAATAVIGYQVFDLVA